MSSKKAALALFPTEDLQSLCTQDHSENWSDLMDANDKSSSMYMYRYISGQRALGDCLRTKEDLLCV